MRVALYIETDAHDTLGGSVLRDLSNLANAASALEQFETHVFTHRALNDTEKSRFPDATFHLHSNDPIKQWRDILNSVNYEFLFVVISGHGYCIRDKSQDEIDGFDEYVCIHGRIILDDSLRKVFIESLDEKSRFVGICDTCHSGSMFDLDEVWGNGWKPATKAEPISRSAISIGACGDMQLENCDIGNTVGFGGALTIHILENKLLPKLFSVDSRDHVQVYETLVPIFRNLRQEPQLERCVLSS